MGLRQLDLDNFQQIRLDTKRSAGYVKQYYWAIINPKDVPCDKVVDLVNCAESSARCIGWLLDEVKRLKEFEWIYNDLNDQMKPS